MERFIDYFVSRLEESGLLSSSVDGCSDGEIKELEDMFELSFPNIYKDFLRKLGHGAGRFLQGTDCFYPSLVKNRQRLIEILDENRISFSLPPTAFVFFSHQAYHFLFFYADNESDDPAIYGYLEGDPHPKISNNHFSDFLISALGDETAAWDGVQTLG